MCISAELDKGEGAVENSNEGNVDMSEGGGNADISEEGGNAAISEGGGKVDISERGEVHEPYVGLEFDSEDEARKFYFDYARRIGFVVRMMQRRISETDKKVIARRLGCNKQGFSPNYGTIGPDNKPRPSAREGCRATILVKLEKSGKWVVSRFEKEHNHPLVVTEQGPSTTPPHISGDKDKKIEFLIRELRRQDQLCAAYREKLLKFLTSIEEQTDQLSSKIQDVVDNVRKVEAEMQQQLPQHR
ncbi:hypothetical protein RHSIM_Rhsim13G0054200 [Rhododendron simsii]|uniref:FAR1 domain-containing protein n=1 Tax=Rhododendron simsii TaxID=118357 RepID=A0A834L3Y1_RHOSS|nr:hypothetical protein RHSIM_Rhsim13G0054200 [Rhododendron simsii]